MFDDPLREHSTGHRQVIDGGYVILISGLDQAALAVPVTSTQT
jgi:hypothetical protein